MTSQVTTRDESVGDMFEIGIALAAFNNQAKDIMAIMESVFFLEHSLDDKFQKDGSKEHQAVKLVALARTWVTARSEQPVTPAPASRE